MTNHEETQEDNTKKSYRDAVMPTSHVCYSDEDEYLEEDWDGCLLIRNEDTMKQGVSILETEQGPHFCFSDKEKRRLEKKWGRSLIVKLIGGNIGFMQLSRRLRALWAKSGKVDLLAIDNGFFVVNFQAMDDYFFALEGGPWVIQNHYLAVQTWKRNFNPWKETIQKLAVWVRLPGLPVEYYDKKFFYNLGNMIGTAIKIDEMTLLRARTLYACMCVEVELGKPLLPAYMVDDNALKIEYEGLHLICFRCGRFGHDNERCSMRASQGGKEGLSEEKGVEERVPPGPAGDPPNQPLEKYGEWMKVKEHRQW